MRIAIFIVSLVTAAFAEPQNIVVPGWPKLPEGHVLGLCAGVGVDAQNRVFVFHRSGRKWSNPFPQEPISLPTVSVIDGASGRLLATWGRNLFIMPHGLTVDHEGNLWLTDVGLHQVFKFTPEGKLLLSLGERAVPGHDRAHFNLPTDVAVLRDGSFYVSDGYKNTRVMKFSAEGRFEFEWGTKGQGDGEFNLPHGIAIDAQGRVIVCDRENERLQVFDSTATSLSLMAARSPSNQRNAARPLNLMLPAQSSTPSVPLAPVPASSSLVTTSRSVLTERFMWRKAPVPGCRSLCARRGWCRESSFRAMPTPPCAEGGFLAAHTPVIKHQNGP
jgi:peptidylamidoglycolate lyase